MIDDDELKIMQGLSAISDKKCNKCGSDLFLLNGDWHCPNHGEDWL